MSRTRHREGEILRNYRMVHDIKADAFAATLGVDPRYLCEVEKGRRPVPEKWLALLPWAVRAPIARKRMKLVKSKLILLRGLTARPKAVYSHPQHSAGCGSNRAQK